MNILMVSSFLPYPLYSGGHVRLFNLIKELSRRHKITLICEKRSYQSQKDINEMKRICEEVVVVERKKQWSLENILKTTISNSPFLLTGHELPAMKKAIAHVLNTKHIDIIHVETFYVFHNIPITSIPTVLAEHNIEYHVYQRFTSHAPLLLRPLLLVDIEKIKYWERKYWQKAKRVVVVSEHDKKEIGRKDTVIVPNGVDLKAFPLKKTKQNTHQLTILFMGDFKWIQNRDSAEFIIKKIWPLIRLRHKALGKKQAIRLWIVGKHIPQSLQQHNSDEIVFDEHAPDNTSDIYAQTDILLSPIRVGGGSSYKILEAMASGVPVVTTELGIRGLMAQKNVHALIGNNQEELALCVEKLITDHPLYSAIQKNARALIQKHYTWPVIAKTLEGVYKDAASKR